MSGWVPFPAAMWAEVAEALPTPWPEGAAIFDLRWLVDQGRAIPGRPTLVKRWGWTDWAVKQLLRDEERWRDPSRQASAASRPPADRQRTTSPQMDRRQESAPNRQRAASAPPADRHTRVVAPSPSPSPSPSPQPPPAPRVGEQSREAWVTSRALGELRDLADRTDEATVEQVLDRWSSGTAGDVDTWVSLTRPQATVTLGERRQRRAWPDAPDGLRRREICAGLRLAVERWRAGDRAPPARAGPATPSATNHPPMDDR